MDMVQQLRITWESRLKREYPKQRLDRRESIIRWLIGNQLESLEPLSGDRFASLYPTLEYRYRILQQHYLEVKPEIAYHRFLDRLGSAIVAQPQVRCWIRQNPSYQKGVVDLLAQSVEYLLSEDDYIGEQTLQIAQCTEDIHLRNALLLATLEEYCLCVVNGQPRVIRYLIAFLDRQNPGKKNPVNRFSAMFEAMERDWLTMHFGSIALS